MMNSTRNPRKTKRVIGLGLAALSMSLFGAEARADNLTSTTAIEISPNSGVTNCVAAAGNVKFFTATLYENRSYSMDTYPIGEEANNPFFVDGSSIRVAKDSAFVNLIPMANSFNAVEGSANVPSLSGNSTRFTITPTAAGGFGTGTHFIKMSGSAAACFYIAIRETTLFSPWLSKAAGFEGFIELHNNTNAAINVTLKGFDSAGTLQGAGLSFSIPGNATVFKTGAAIGVPVDVAAGVVLTHDGTFGAISGNITTLNGANGLSFDSPFTPRTEYIRQH